MKSRNIELVEETNQITDCGYYCVGGKNISLKDKLSMEDFSDTIVYSPKKLKKVYEDVQKEREQQSYIKGERNLFLLEADALLVAKEFENPLVLNFADAKEPGGGYIKGIRSQEESLCMASTLYASLNSKKAKEMYAYNKCKNPQPLFSDYMLLTPEVGVFRDFERNLLEEPFSVSVLSVPAVDKKREAKNCSQEEIDVAMIQRIREFLAVAMKEGYRNLILGAWGCGAYGHNAKKVASYFKQVLLVEDYADFFDYIIFAVVDTPKKKRIHAFQEVFSKEIESFVTEEGNGEEPIGFFPFEYDFPICNQDYSEINLQENLGTMQGVFADGTPFQAELWIDPEYQSKNVTFVLPYKKELFVEDEEAEELLQSNKDSNVEYFYTTMEFVWNTLLCDGMEIVDDEVNFASTDKHIIYLINMGVIAFQNDMVNGIVHVLKDYADHMVTAVNICLESDGKEDAKIGLQFHPFTGPEIDKASRKAQLKVIKNENKLNESKRNKNK